MRWRPARPRGLAAVVVVGALAPAVLGLAWVVSRSVDSPLATDQPVAPQVVPVGSSTRDSPVSAALAVEASESFQVTAAGSGIVTEVAVAAEDTLGAGDAVITVDDQQWVAFVSDAPAWRDLRLGMRGDDVDRVREFLDELGFPSGTVPGKVTPATVEGIRQFNRSLRRGDTDRVLHRETLLWVGDEPLPVGEVVAEVGDAVSPGQSVLAGPTPSVSIVVTELEPVAMPDANHILRVGTVEVPYQPGSGQIAGSEAATAVADALLGETEGGGTIRLAEPEEVATLPVAAIVTDQAGRTCVFTSAAGPPVPVEVSGGTLSKAELPVDWVGRQVLVNPRAVREDLSCG